MTPRPEVLAWERIARAFAAYAVTGRATLMTRHALSHVIFWLDAPIHLRGAMHERLGYFGLDGWPLDRGHAGPRALFAQLMAELAREELG